MSTDVTSDANGKPESGASGTVISAEAAAPQAPVSPAPAPQAPVSGKMSRESVTVIVTLLVATFVVILNETIMNVALQRLKSGWIHDVEIVQFHQRLGFNKRDGGIQVQRFMCVRAGLDKTQCP